MANQELYDMFGSRDAWIIEQRDLGNEVFEPEDDELFIDIDSDEHMFRFHEACNSFNQTEWGPVRSMVTPSKSGLPHRHIRVKLPFKIESPWQRIALQAIFGSDRTREFMSAFRVLTEIDKPTLFVESDELLRQYEFLAPDRHKLEHEQVLLCEPGLG